MRRIVLAALTALTLGTIAGTVPAGAQYDGGYGGPRRFDRRYDEDRYDRRRGGDEDRFERRRFGRGGYGGGRGGSVCVTARGNCVTRPAPFNSACGCEIPGFGFKRGQIGG